MLLFSLKGYQLSIFFLNDDSANWKSLYFFITAARYALSLSDFLVNADIIAYESLDNLTKITRTLKSFTSHKPTKSL